MTATYTFDVFSSLNGCGAAPRRHWGGYWGEEGRAARPPPRLYDGEQRMVFEADAAEEFVQMLGPRPRSPA